MSTEDDNFKPLDEKKDLHYNCDKGNSPRGASPYALATDGASAVAGDGVRDIGGDRNFFMVKDDKDKTNVAASSYGRNVHPPKAIAKGTNAYATAGSGIHSMKGEENFYFSSSGKSNSCDVATEAPRAVAIGANSSASAGSGNHSMTGTGNFYYSSDGKTDSKWEDVALAAMMNRFKSNT